MKFRLVWDIHYNQWKLQTPPCVSSAWDTVTRNRWQWPLYIRAWCIAVHWKWVCRHEGVIKEFEV